MLTLVALAACNTRDITGVSGKPPVAALARTTTQPILEFDGGVVVDRSTGRSMAMPSDMQDLYVRSLEAQRQYVSLKARFDRDPRVRAVSARGPLMARDAARAHVDRVLGKSRAGSSRAGLAILSSVEAPINCDDIALAINYTDVDYRSAQTAQTTALNDIFDLSAVGDLGGAANAYMEWRSASIDIIFLQTELGFLASMYSGYGCWN